MNRDEAIERLATERAQKLQKFSRTIISCRVVIELPHRRHQTGNHYNVRIDLSIPGREVAINRDPTKHGEKADIHVALKEAFEAAERELEDFKETKIDLKRGA